MKHDTHWQPAASLGSIRSSERITATTTPDLEGGVIGEEPWCFKPSNCCSGQSQEWSLEAQRASIYKEQEWVQGNDMNSNAGNYSSFYSLHLDFKISKGSRIYEGG